MQMSLDKINPQVSVFGQWVKENNELINKWKQDQGCKTLIPDHNLRCCSSEFQKLLRKIQGIPPLVDHTELELTVAYNTSVCATAQSQFSEAELLLKWATERALQTAEDNQDAEDTPVFWKKVLNSAPSETLNHCVLNLLCLQWAIWLAKCQLKTIEEFKDVLFSLAERLSSGLGNDTVKARGNSSDFPRLMMDPRQLSELLHICTLIALGAERLSEGQSTEGLSDLQKASSLPAPRSLIAYTHLLSGSCLSHMNCPQMALLCHRKALETDPQCASALYQSMLIYRQMDNTQAEIQALRLLHSTLMLPCATEPPMPSTHLISPSLLLCSQSLSSLLSVPSALFVLHSLALKCVLHGRVSEGVESFLDLLASLYSENHHAMQVETTPLPKMPELYLEAGAALLMAHRPADCIALCDEVIGTTLELLPDRMVLEEGGEKYGAEHGDCPESEDRVKMLLWAGSAYLLQGHCYSHLKDWKQAVTHYTRCINLLMRVHFKKKGFQPEIPRADMVSNEGSDLCTLERLKSLSLAGRGISFSQTDKLREALRDLQLSVQAHSVCQGAWLWCGEVLWRLGRGSEAAACWEKTWTLTAQSSEESLSVYLHEPQTGPLLDSTVLRRRIQELGPVTKRKGPTLSSL